MNFSSPKPTSIVLLVSSLLMVVAGYWFSAKYTTSSASTEISVTRVDWVKTRVLKQAGESPVIVESGVVYIAADGRVRTETTRVSGSSGQNTSVQILDYQNNTRHVLNLERKTAARSALRRPSRSGRERSGASYTSGGVLVSDDLNTSIAEKTIDGLTLKGSRQTMTLNGPDGTSILVSHETWSYDLGVTGGGILPLEHRYEDARTSENRRITQVSNLVMSGDIFLIPPDFIEN